MNHTRFEKLLFDGAFNEKFFNFLIDIGIGVSTLEELTKVSESGEYTEYFKDWIMQ